MKSLLVYLGATSPRNPVYEDAVRELGEKMAKRGITLVFGGSREGTMTVLADAVLQNGGHAVGVFTKSLPRDFLYEGLPETIITENFAERKATMLARADAIVAMPGSFGTGDELFDALEQAKADIIFGRTPKKIAVLNVNGYYDSLLQFIRHSADEGYTTRQFANMLLIASTVDELLEILD